MSKITNDTYASHIYGVVYDGKEKIGYIVL
jgi:hypothetical protein